RWQWAAWALGREGDVGGGVTGYKGALDGAKRGPAAGNGCGGVGFNTVWRATWEADQGRPAEAQATLALSLEHLTKYLGIVPKESFAARYALAEAPRFTALVLWGAGDYAGARDNARKAVSQLTTLKTTTQGGARVRAGSLA